MPKFIVIMHQANGCDYTIGCGVAVHNVEAEDLDHARRAVRPFLSEEYYSEETINSLTHIDIYEIAAYARLTPDAWRT